MFGTISDEMEVNVAASQAWALYGTLRLSELVGQQLSHLVQKIDVLEGDGSVGTLLKLTFPPGTPVFTTYNEKFTKVDNETRIKEAEVVEGGYLDLGFNLYRVRFEIIEKGEKSCITKSTIEYEVKEESAANASFVSLEPLKTIMNVAANYLTNLSTN